MFEDLFEMLVLKRPCSAFRLLKCYEDSINTMLGSVVRST